MMIKIYNAKLFRNGSFQKGGIVFDEKIRALGSVSPEGGLDADGCWLLPGLVDIHTHAAVGADASDGNLAGLAALSRYYAGRGVTAWCATTMTLPEPVLRRAMEAVRQFRRPSGGARLAGVHLEGPFLSPAKKGAQAADSLRRPDIGLFHRLNEASGGAVRMVTVAPELPGAMDLIREVSGVCTVSLGHTGADYASAMAAYGAGASHATHLFNAMPPFHHRSPGVVGAAFDAGASAELICDGIHCHPAAVRMAFRLFAGRLALVSDSMRCAGLTDGAYTLGGQDVTVKNGRATLKGTDTLAGSSIHLLDGLRNAVAFGVPLEEAAASATSVPARIAGLDRWAGSLAVGRMADLLLLDQDLGVKRVYAGGQLVEKL